MHRIQENIQFTQRQFFRLLISLVFLCGILFACTVDASQANENGLNFMRMYNPDETGGAGQNFAVVQDTLDLMYVANLMAVLEFDGGRWRAIQHPEHYRAVSLDIDDSGRIYVGYQGDMGYLATDRQGRKRVISLRAQIPDSIQNIGYIWGTQALPRGVVYRSPHRVYRWIPDRQDPRIGQMDIWSFPEENRLLGMTLIDGKPIFWQANVGLMEIIGNECAPVHGGELLADIPVRDVIPYDDTSWLLACETHGLYLFDGESLRQFFSPADLYARTAFALGLTPLRDNLFALATRFGGLLLFDREGNIRDLYDQVTGLQDNNVLSAPYVDRQGAMWVPLNYGLVRIEAPSPIEYYDYNLGIEGNIYSILRHNGILYLGTSQGLRVLRPSDEPGRPASFSTVPGTEDRYWALFSVHNRLFCISTRGLEEVHGPSRRTSLIQEVGMGYCATVSNDSMYLYLGTYNQGVTVFQWRHSSWQYYGRLAGTSPQVLDIVADAEGDLWLMANYRHIERVSIDPRNNLSLAVTVYDTAKGLPGLSHYYPIVLNGDLLVGNTRGLFRYDAEIDEFVPDSTLGEQFGSGSRGMWNLTLDSSGNVWFNSQFAKGARVSPGSDGAYELNYPLLRASTSNFLCFYPEEHGDVLWAGAENGRLIRYDDTVELPDSVGFTALVRRLVANGDSLLLDGSVSPFIDPPRLPYSMNSLRFEFSLPRYDALNANRFKYRLVGLTDEWSDWSEETYKDFNSLYEGRYRFEVIGYDVYYFESETGSYEFYIQPPWYRTYWSYIAYLLVFFAIIYGFYKWRTRQIEAQKRHLEKIVQKRTLELKEANAKIHEYNNQLEELLEKRTRDLIRSERQAVFGQLVQGIVHNLKNPLQSSTMSTQMIRLAVAKSQAAECKNHDEELVMLRAMAESVTNTVEWLEKANSKLKHMIDSLLTKSRLDTQEQQVVVDLNELVKTEVEFMQADTFFKNKVKKEINLIKGKVMVQVVPGEMSQVIQNLIRNAIDAMLKIPSPKLNVRTTKMDGTIYLYIADNGEGIPENIQDRIFDPFFTTKHVDGDETVPENEPKGTGLGLWMSHEAMRSFGGSIAVQSIKGEGTTFTLSLPEAI